MMKRTLAAVAAFVFVLIGALPSSAQMTKSAVMTQIASCFPDNNSGLITPAIQRQCLNNIVNSYQQYTSVRAVTLTADTLQVADYGQLVTYANASPVAVTLPQGSGSFFPWNVYVSNLGAGTVTITPTLATIGGASSLILTTNQSAFIVADGSSNYQVALSSNSGAGGTRIRLTADTNFYVNGNSSSSQPCNGQTCSAGNDSNNGLSVTAPFLTGQHAVNVVAQNYDSNGFNATIVFADAPTSSVAAANYPVACNGGVLGNPFIFLQGNSSSPTNVHMTAPNGGTAVFAGDGCEFKVTDIQIDDAGSAANAMRTSEHSIIDVVGTTIGSFNSSAVCINATKNAVINFNVASSSFLGNCGQALLADNTGIIQVNPGIQFNFPNNGTFTNVASAINGGLLKGFTSSSFNIGGTITTSGPRALFSGTVLNFAGSACAAIFPGSAACSFTNLATDDTNEGTPALRSLVSSGFIYVTLTGVNFNSATTDNAVPITLPQGMTRFVFNTAYITNASHSLTTATIGVFGTTGGGSLTMAADQAITVSATADATNNNAQSLTSTNGNTQSYVLANLPHTPNVYARIGTPEGATATGDVTVVIRPLP